MPYTFVCVFTCGSSHFIVNDMFQSAATQFVCMYGVFDWKVNSISAKLRPHQSVRIWYTTNGTRACVRACYVRCIRVRVLVYDLYPADILRLYHHLNNLHMLPSNKQLSWIYLFENYKNNLIITLYLFATNFRERDIFFSFNIKVSYVHNIRNKAHSNIVLYSYTLHPHLPPGTIRQI